MTIEQLMEQGYTKEQATQIMKLHNEALKDKFVPKHRFDEVNDKNKQLEQSVTDRDTQIKNLKKFEGDADALKTKIEELETSNKEKDAQHQKEISELKVNNAIKFALNGKVQDKAIDLVEGLIERDKIKINDDGTVLGLDEQLAKIKEDRSFLFTEEGKKTQVDPNKNPGFKFEGSDPDDKHDNQDKTQAEMMVESLISDRTQGNESITKANETYFN